MGFIRLTPNDKRNTTSHKISPEEKSAYYRRMVKNHIEDLRERGASDEEVTKFKNGLSDFIKKEIAPEQKPIVAPKKEGAAVAEALFDVIYSVDIPVEIKEAALDVAEFFPIGINEDCVSEEVNSFIEFLDSIVYSSASEELVEQLLDEVLPTLDEAFINEVSDEWVKRKVQDSMAARKSAADSADRSVKSGIVGLSQLRRQDQAQQNLEAGKTKAASIQARLDKRNTAEPKEEVSKTEPANTGAMGKLKSVVGKVKNWASSVDKGPDYVGLSRAIGRKANKDNIGAEKLRQQTTHKVEAEPEAKVEPPKVKPEQAPSVKAKKVNVAKENGVAKAEKPKVGAEQPAVKAEVKADDATKAAKKKVATATATEAQPKAKKAKVEKPKAEPEVVQQKLDVEAPKEEPKATKTTRAKKVEEVKEKAKAKVEQPAAETPKEVKAGPEQPKATKTTRAKKVEEVKEKAKEAATKETVKNGKKAVAKAISSPAETPKEVKAEPEQPKAEAPKKRTGKIVINAKGRNLKKTSEEQPAAETSKEVKAESEQPKATEKKQPAAETPKEKAVTSIAKEGTTENKDNSAEANNKPVKANSSDSSNNDVKRQRAIAKAQEELKQWQDREAEILRKIEDAKKFPEYKSSTGEYEERLQNVRDRIKDRQIDLNRLQGESVKEAISDLAILLTHTNISENCFVEVMEMVAANKANAQKALARDEDNAMAVIDDINKDLQAGKPVDPEKVKKAEELRKKKEHFEKMFNDKFNNNQ